MTSPGFELSAMNSSRFNSELSLPSNIDQAIETILTWLWREQSTICSFFDRNPSCRQSFLKAVQQVVGLDPMMTPAATPAEMHKDDESVTAVFDSNADQTGPINCDDDQTACYNTHSAANDERLDTLEQTQGRWTDSEGVGVDLHARPGISTTVGDDALRPRAPSSDHRRRQKQARKRKHTVHCEVNSRQLAGEMGTLSSFSSDLVYKIDKIAGPETLATLWYCLRARRESYSQSETEGVVETPNPSNDSIEDQLLTHRLQYRNRTETALHGDKSFPEIPQRLYWIDIISLYMREKAARQKVKTKRARPGDRKRDMAGGPRRSLRDIFVNFLSEEKEGCQATRVFDNVLALGQRWIILVEYFGRGILLLIPEDLTNEDLRVLKLDEVDALVRYLNSSKPSLRTDVLNLTSILPPLIEGRSLPNRRLKLQMMSERQIISGEHVAQPLRDLLEYPNSDCTSFLTEHALADFSQSSTDISPSSLGDPEGEVGVRTSLPDNIDYNNPGITSYVDYLYLVSPLDGKMDW